MSLPELAIALGLAWGAGLRLYLVLFLVGLAGRLGWVGLPQDLQVLSGNLALGASGFMVAVEFLADKVPWIDTVWDAVHTFIRIPAGAALAVFALGDQPGAAPVALAILGGTVAAGAHFAKAGARGALNASPEPFTNWGASLAEDAAVPIGLWLAVAHPVVFLVFLVLFVAGALVLLRFIVRGLRTLFRSGPLTRGP